MTIPPHAVEAQRLAEQLRGQGDEPEPLFEVEAVQSPAANYGCPVGLAGCPSCRPDAWPCGEFMGIPSDPETEHWCPRCGWAEWAHDGGASS